MAEMEQKAARDGIPIVHWETGRFLAALAQSLPRHACVLEVGTAIGYSTLHMAEALDETGKIFTLERDAVRVDEARGFLDRGGVGDRVDVIEGDALDTLISLEGPFDLLFLDASKGEYGRYLELAETKATNKALLVIDNVLMSGSVAIDDDVEVPDEFGSWWSLADRQGARALSSSLIDSDGWLSVVLPVGDGVVFAARQ